MKIKKLAAAVGVALSLGIVSQQAHAVMETECCGNRGDTLMFPAFIGMSGFENYYAITNDANAWIQGHLRFRGAAWCGELKDFDVILSPGDVFVFRVADVDGDGHWEIDQTLDERNFQYTGLLEVPDQGDTGLATSHCSSSIDNTTHWKCMDSSHALIPNETDIFVTEGRIAYQQQVGYIQFFGEAILTDMTHDMMAILLSGVPGDWEPYQTDVFSKRGTTSWKWSNAAGQFARFAPNPPESPWVGDRGLADVPNMLSGVGFISQTDRAGVGVAFNAMAFSDFRTENTNHRLDNYRVADDGFHIDIPRDANGHPSVNIGDAFLGVGVGDEDTLFRNGQPVSIRHAGSSKADRAVIVHDENGASSPAGTSPRGDYIYGFGEGDLPGGLSYEASISFNNTWGPTLADGDDYIERCSSTIGGVEVDDFDIRDVNSLTNSVAEVEEAIRNGRQHFGGYYFDKGAPGPHHQGSTTLKSWYFAWFPTKFFYAESPDLYATTNLDEYVLNAARFLVGAVTPPKTYIPQVWDIDEHTAGPEKSTVTIGQCISPAIGPECFTTTTGTGFDPELYLSECLSVFNIGQVKTAFSPHVGSFSTGRFMLSPKTGFNEPEQECNINLASKKSWPAMMYSFEWGTDNSLAHWRCLIR